MTLSEKLTSLRKEHKLSQGEVAERLDVSRQSVSKWETGQSVPELDKIVRLADLYGVTVDELVREEERIQPPEPQAVQEKASPKGQAAGGTRERLIDALLQWDPVWPWLEGHRRMIACVLLILAVPAFLLKANQWLVLVLPVLAGELLLIKQKRVPVLLVTLLIASGLACPSLGVGYLIAIFFYIIFFLLFL